MADLFEKEIKMAYIESLPPSNQSRIFRTTAAFFEISREIETPAGKAVYRMEKEELLPWLSKVNYASPASTQAFYTSLKAYIGWAMGRGLSSLSCNPMNRIPIRAMELGRSIGLNLFKDAEDLSRYLRLFDVAEYDFAVPAAILLYAGLTKEEIAELRETDVSLQTGEIFLNGRRAVLSEAFLPILREYAKAETRQIQRRYVETVLRLNSGLFLKKYVTKKKALEPTKICPALVYLAVNKLSGKAYQELGEKAAKGSAQNLIDAGRYFRMRKENEQEASLEERIQGSFHLTDEASVRCVRLWFEAYLKYYF